uniref:Uncharacterized protein n=1 Tax=viral metagenome TaxID=1070528 RepID=A0A6M3IRH2_9ZZZZ
MKTIELEKKEPKASKILRKVVNLVNAKDYFHFFYEPQLIIRIPDSIVKSLIKCLKIKKVKYKIYDYPFPKHGGKWGSNKEFGEGKKGIIIKYFSYFKHLLTINSAFALGRKKRDDYKIIERYTHTFLNQLGYAWTDEALILLELATKRMKNIKNYEAKTVFEKLWCNLIIFTLIFSIRLVKLFRYENN